MEQILVNLKNKLRETKTKQYSNNKESRNKNSLSCFVMPAEAGIQMAIGSR